MYDSIDAPEAEATAIGDLANVYASKQLPAGALSLYHHVLAIDKTLGNELTIAFDLETLAPFAMIWVKALMINPIFSGQH